MDINRARVLRVRSVMTADSREGMPEISASSTLEDALEMSGGGAGHVFRVMDQGKRIEALRMIDVFKALVARHAQNGSRGVPADQM